MAILKWNKNQWSVEDLNYAKTHKISQIILETCGKYAHWLRVTIFFDNDFVLNDEGPDLNMWKQLMEVIK